MKPHIYKHNGQWYARAFDRRGTQHIGFDNTHDDPAHAYSSLIDSIEESNNTAHAVLRSTRDNGQPLDTEE